MFGYRARLGKLCVLAVFVLLTTGTAGAGVLSLWDGTGRMTRQVGQRWALTVQLSHIVLRRHRRMASRFPVALQVLPDWWRYNVRQPRRAVGQEAPPSPPVIPWFGRLTLTLTSAPGL